MKKKGVCVRRNRGKNSPILAEPTTAKNLLETWPKAAAASKMKRAK